MEEKMIKNLSIFKVAVFVVALAMIAGTASASYFELTNVDGTLDTSETYYTMEIVFNGEDTDNLNTYFLSVEYDSSLVSYAGIIYETYTRGSGFDEYDLWIGGDVPATHNEAESRIEDINGSEDFDHQGEFFPVATGETLMATIAFTPLVDGSYEDIATWGFGPTSELIQVNDALYVDEEGLVVSKSGSSSVISPVPLPGAILLFGTGLLSFLGIRRRK